LFICFVAQSEPYARTPVMTHSTKTTQHLSSGSKRLWNHYC